LEAAIERGIAYKEAGADLIQPISKGVRNIDELRRFKSEVQASLSLQILAWLETDLEETELQKLAAIATWPLVPLMTATQAIRANLGQLIKDKSSFRLPIDRVAMAEFNQMIGLPEIEELQLKYLPQNIR